MLLSICAFINANDFTFDGPGHKFNDSIALAFMIITICLPIWMFIFFWWYTEKLTLVGFTDKYGIVYDQLYVYRKGFSAIVFKVAFLVR